MAIRCDVILFYDGLPDTVINRLCNQFSHLGMASGIIDRLPFALNHQDIVGSRTGCFMDQRRIGAADIHVLKGSGFAFRTGNNGPGHGPF